MERCPVCRSELPPAKTCPGCGKEFYRSTEGRLGTECCSVPCAARVRKRRQRQRQNDSEQETP